MGRNRKPKTKYALLKNASKKRPDATYNQKQIRIESEHTRRKRRPKTKYQQQGSINTPKQRAKKVRKAVHNHTLNSYAYLLGNPLPNYPSREKK